MRHLDLFSGIGGFALAASQVFENYETVAFCEIDPFCRAVLAKNFPGVPIHDNIKTFTNTTNSRIEGLQERKDGIFLVTGGFPCQPFSQAGRRQGTSDDRYLWPEMFRVIQEFHPTWVIAENVSGLVTWSEGMVLEQVCADLESEGYEVQPLIIPAVAVNAPHRRDRIWIIGYSPSNGSYEPKNGQSDHQRDDDNSTRTDEFRKSQRTDCIRKTLDVADTECQGRKRERNSSEGQYGFSHRTWKDEKQSPDWSRDWREVAATTCHDGVDDGLSRRMGGLTISRARWRREALKAYGNAIVPQVAMEIMKVIQAVDRPSGREGKENG